MGETNLVASNDWRKNSINITSNRYTRNTVTIVKLYISKIVSYWCPTGHVEQYKWKLINDELNSVGEVYTLLFLFSQIVCNRWSLHRSLTPIIADEVYKRVHFVVVWFKRVLYSCRFDSNKLRTVFVKFFSRT